MPGLSCRILLYMLYSTIHDANDWCGHDRLCCVKLCSFSFFEKRKENKKMKKKRKSPFIVQLFLCFIGRV